MSSAGTSRIPHSLSLKVVWLIFVTGTLIAFGHYARRGSPPIATWDVYGYWSYLPAAITFGDLREFDFAQEHFERYSISSQLFQLTDTRFGRMPVYTNGLAILWAPGYLISELVASQSDYERDGMSQPYQLSILISCLLYGFIGLLVLRRFLLRYFSEVNTAATLMFVVFGTNLFHYWCQSPGMPHAYLFTCHALMLYWTDSWFRNPRTKYMVGVAVVMTIACLVRPTEILMGILPLVYVLLKYKQVEWRREYALGIVAGAVTAAVLLAPQLVLWKANTGLWIFNAYADAGHEFHFDGRYLLDGLFSYRKGWLLYTPVMGVCLLGLALLKGEARYWRWPIIAITIAYIFITFSWHWWWYANSFGSRAMIHIYPELSVGLAAVLTYCGRRRLTYLLLGLLLVALTVLNLFQTWQYNHKVLPGDGVNQYYYWKTFGKTSVDRQELKYLFVPHLRDKESMAKQTLGRLEFDSINDLSQPAQDDFFVQNGLGSHRITSDVSYSDAIVFEVTEETSASVSGAWIEMQSTVFLAGNQFNSMRNALHSIEVGRGDEVLMWQGLNFQVYLPQDEWVTDTWEFKLPSDLQAGDVFKYFIWNRNSPDTIYLHGLNVSLLKKEVGY